MGTEATCHPKVATGARKAAGVLVACCAPLALMTAARPDARAAGETFRDVAFTAYGEHSSNGELARRLLSPLTAARQQRELARVGAALAGQPVKLADETFVVYVPSQHSARGYGLLVFVPPWQDARLPPGWAPVLDRFGVIFVSAARSGNEENVLARREPLALLAADNIMQRYPVDPERVYVGGFSGGSRVALRLALGYPDLFRGGLLDAGSDPIGSSVIPLPPRELLFQFQSASRLVYVSGKLDVARAADDAVSIYSVHKWCAFGADGFLEPGIAHEVVGPAALARALRSLTSSTPPDAAKLAACRAAIEAKLAAQLRRVETLIDAGRTTEARKLLTDIDDRFGGLAAPQSLDLESKL